MAHRHRRRQAQAGVPTAVIVTATIFCLPCICILGGIGLTTSLIMKLSDWESPRTKRKRDMAARKKETKRRTPRVLEPRLERHLTIGREMASSGAENETFESKSKRKDRMTRPPARTEQQAQSILFKLPLEVRTQIYEEAIGGYVFHPHYVQTYKRFGHVRCKGKQCDGFDCRQQTKQPGAKDEWGAIDLMALLKSCRRIYSEAVQILYAKNSFEFESLNHVLNFSLMVLPERMQLIRQVEWRTLNAPWGILHSSKTPWLECHVPHSCSCIACLPRQAYTDTNVHEWVIYTWHMRMVEQSPPEAVGSSE